MKTNSLGNISALVLIGGFIGALLALDAWTNNGNFSLFDFSIGNSSLEVNAKDSPSKESNKPTPEDPNTSTSENHPYSIQGSTQVFRETAFDTYIADLEKDHIAFFLKDEKGENISSIHNLDLQLQQGEKSLLFATNGGMFTPTHEPVGLYIEEGKVIEPINLKKEKGNFFMQPNGVFGISKKGTAHILQSKSCNKQWQSELDYATQSGPMLLINGKINGHFGEKSPNKLIRSGVGIIDTQTVVFAISNEPVNFYDFASFFRQNYGCQNALYLDGVVSEMYLPELGRYDSTGRFGVMIGIEGKLREEL